METKKFRIAIDPATLVPKAAVRRYYWWSMAIVWVMAVGVGVVWKSLPRVVPLLFTEPWGEARLVPRLYLAGLPLLGLLVTMVNVILSKTVPEENKALGYSLAVGALLINVMLMVSLYGIGQSLL